MGNWKGKHLKVMGLLGLGNDKIPRRVEGIAQKAVYDEPHVCDKCGATAFRQHGRQFVCVLCGEDVWLVKEALQKEVGV